jgi:hypothetical protein
VLYGALRGCTLSATSEDYRGKAAECLALAKKIRDPEAKEVLDRIARSWLMLAEQEDRRSR